MSWRVRLCFVALSVVWLAPPSTAAAAPGAAAAPSGEALLRQATQRFDEGDFPGARELLRRARRTTRAARVLARVALLRGLIEAVENEPALARRYFREAIVRDLRLRVDPERHKPALVGLFAAVRAELVGRVELALSRPEPGSAVWVDGVRAGAAPVAREVLAGPHTVTLRDGSGAVLLRKTVNVTAGKTLRVVLAPPPSPAASPEPVVLPATDKPQRGGRLWTWVTGAGALAFLAAAIATGASATQDHDEACALLDDPSLPCADRVRLKDPATDPRYRTLQGRVERKAVFTNVSWALAGTLAASAALLYWLEGRRLAREPERRGSSLGWGVSPAGVAFDLLF